jgi:DNA-binding response OmpR family regulator
MNRKQILAVDDDPDILDIIEEVLSDMGYRVERAGSIEEGERRLHNSQPHLVLLDLHLPDRNGSYLARKLKNHDETKHIPIILFSSHNELEFTASDVKADSYLAKPFDLDELVEAVGKLLPPHNFNQL